jgi:hypothetical protein
MKKTKNKKILVKTLQNPIGSRVFSGEGSLRGETHFSEKMGFSLQRSLLQQTQFELFI